MSVSFVSERAGQLSTVRCMFEINSLSLPIQLLSRIVTLKATAVLYSTSWRVMHHVRGGRHLQDE